MTVLLRSAGVVLGALVGGAWLGAAPVAAGTTPFYGEIMIVPYTFCPDGWLEANGQLLPINQNIELFSLLGVTYGGNGSSTFALPNITSAFTTTTTVDGTIVTAPLAAKACIAVEGAFPPTP